MQAVLFRDLRHPAHTPATAAAVVAPAPVAEIDPIRAMPIGHRS